MNTHAVAIGGKIAEPISSDRSAALIDRTLSIDAVRGLAMLLVCFSHFGITYFATSGALSYANVSRLMGLPASAIFILLSGVTIGFLRQRSGERFIKQRLKCVDRGLFLLLPGHLIILAAHYWVGLRIGPGTHWVFITDAIGVCLIVGPYLISETSGGVRACIGVALITLSWWLYLNWYPVGGTAQVIKAILTGAWSAGVVFPIMPWLGAFLIATPIGEQFALRQGKSRLYFLGALAALFFVGGAIAHLASHRPCDFFR